ncbi:MAG: hypothetical protein HC815_09200 [Richelia sp. RM1_1_1]|nr:hypothetical protein [Richelia sp. RM1_1_1]
MTRKKQINLIVLASLLIGFGISISLSACNQGNPNTQPTPEQTQPPQADNEQKEPPVASLLKVPGISNSDPLSLLSKSEQVKQELNLTDEQISQLQQLQKDMLADIEKIKSEPRPKESDKQNGKKEINDKRLDVQKRVEEILKPEQIERSKQIFLQLYGYGPLTHELFKSDLKLTAEQESKLQELNKEMFVNVYKSWKNPIGTQEEQNKILVENALEAERIVVDTNNKATALLTPEQEKTLETLKGKEFKLDTSKLKS